MTTPAGRLHRPLNVGAASRVDLADHRREIRACRGVARVSLGGLVHFGLRRLLGGRAAVTKAPKPWAAAGCDIGQCRKAGAGWARMRGARVRLRAQPLTDADGLCLLLHLGSGKPLPGGIREERLCSRAQSASGQRLLAPPSCRMRTRGWRGCLRRSSKML